MQNTPTLPDCINFVDSIWYLTFLNIHQLERQGADIQTKVEELEELNQSLRQHDKVKMML